MNPRDLALAHATLRVGLGFNLFMHGVSRFITGPSGFAHGMSKGFEATVLPVPLAYAFALPLPFFEFGFGLLLILGLFRRAVLLAVSALLLALTFGVCLQAKWDVAAQQLMYQLVVAAVLCTCGYDAYSLDSRRLRGRRA